MDVSLSTVWLPCLFTALCAVLAEGADSTRYVDAGMNVTLLCAGQRATSTVWAVGGKDVANLPGARHIITRNGDLVIRSVTIRDGGLYTCRTSKSASSALSSILLEVQDIAIELRVGNVSENTYPLYPNIQDTVYVRAGSLIQFSGKLLTDHDGNHEGSWTLNGSTQYLSRPFYCLPAWVEKNMTLQVTLFSAHAAHSGRYTFHSGTLAKSVNIQVIGYAPFPNKQYVMKLAHAFSCKHVVLQPLSTAPPPTTSTSPPTTTTRLVTTSGTSKSTAPLTSPAPTLSSSSNQEVSSAPHMNSKMPTTSPHQPITDHATSFSFPGSSSSSQSNTSTNQNTSSLLLPIVAAVIGFLLLAILIMIIIRRRLRSKEIELDPRLSKVYEFFPAGGTSALGPRTSSVTSKASYSNQSQCSSSCTYLARETPPNRTLMAGTGEGSTPLLRPLTGRLGEPSNSFLQESCSTPPASRINLSTATPPPTRFHQTPSSTPVLKRDQSRFSDAQQPPPAQEPYKHRAVTALQEAAVRLGPSPGICRKCSSSDELGLDSDSDMEDIRRGTEARRSKDDSAFGITSHSHRRGRHRVPTRALTNRAFSDELASSAPTNLNVSRDDTPQFPQQSKLAENACQSDSGLGSSYAIHNSSSATLLSPGPDVSPVNSVEEGSFIMSKNAPVRQLSSSPTNGVVYEEPWHDYDSVSSDYTPEVAVRRKSTHRSRRRMEPNPRSPPTDSPPEPYNEFFPEPMTDL